MTPANPFQYGRSVAPRSFVGRAAVLQTLYSRILTGDSTAVVGMPHVGKSSLLRYLAHPPVYASHLPAGGPRYAFVHIDCQSHPQEQGPPALWQRILRRTRLTLTEPAHQQLLGELCTGPLEGDLLEDLFLQLDGAGARVVLILDEFDALLHHPLCCHPDFLGPLRALCSRGQGLSLLLASRLTLTQLLERTARINQHGSPYLNFLVEIPLPLFDADEGDQLIERALRGTGVEFSPEDRALLVRLSGRHPFLLQAAAACLFEVKCAARCDDATRGASIHERVTSLLTERAVMFREDMWRYLDAEAREELLLLAGVTKPAKLSQRSGSEGILRLQRAGLLINTDGGAGPLGIAAEILATWLRARHVLSVRRCLRVFCSCADADEEHLGALVKHLASLDQQGLLSLWHQGLALAGSTRAQDIEAQLEAADVILLLLSSDFLAAQQLGSQLDRSLARHRHGEAVLVPIRLRPALLAPALLDGVLSLPTGDLAVTQWPNQDAAWTDIATQIMEIVQRRVQAG